MQQQQQQQQPATAATGTRRQDEQINVDVDEVRWLAHKHFSRLTFAHFS